MSKIFGVHSKGPEINPQTVTFTLTNMGNATVSSGTIARDGIYAIGRCLISIGSSLPTGTLTLNLPAGYNSSATGNIEGSIETQTTTQYVGIPYQLTATTIIFQGNGTGNWDATHPLTWANTNAFWVNFRTPISTWSANDILKTSDDTKI
jgi:hypothetical protein